MPLYDIRVYTMKTESVGSIQSETNASHTHTTRIPHAYHRCTTPGVLTLLLHARTPGVCTTRVAWYWSHIRPSFAGLRATDRTRAALRISTATRPMGTPCQATLTLTVILTVTLTMAVVDGTFGSLRDGQL